MTSTTSGASGHTIDPRNAWIMEIEDQTAACAMGLSRKEARDVLAAYASFVVGAIRKSSTANCRPRVQCDRNAVAVRSVSVRAVHEFPAYDRGYHFPCELPAIEGRIVRERQ